MTKYVEAIIKSDLSIDELDDDYLFEKGIISISQANTGKDQCISFHFDKKIEYIIYDSDIMNVELKFIEFDINVIINEMVLKSYPQQCIEYYLSKIND